MMLLLNLFLLLGFLFYFVGSYGPLLLGFLLLFYSIMISVFIGCFSISLYGFLLFLVMGGSVVVAFLFAVSIIETHSFYVDKFSENYKLFIGLVVSFGLWFLGYAMNLGNDFFITFVYSSFVLLGLALVIVFCLLGVVKSCSYGSGPLRSLKVSKAKVS